MRAENDLILREVAGEYILIPVGAMALKIHGIISLTESGRLLWERLQEECCEEGLVAAVRQEYDIDQETAVQDVRSFLKKLKDAGLLVQDGNEE